MNYGLIYAVNKGIDETELNQMNQNERRKYIKNLEQNCMKTESVHSSKDLELMKFRLDQVSTLEEMKKELNMEEFKQLIYEKEGDNIDVSGDTVLFYSMFENAVRTGYDMVCIAKNEMDILTDILHFYYVSLDDAGDSYLMKYFDDIIKRKMESVDALIHLCSVAIGVTSDFIDKYVLEFVGLKKEFYMNIDMLMYTHKELDDMNVVLECLKSDGFSVSKMLVRYGEIRSVEGLDDENCNVCYDVEHQKVCGGE